MKRNCTGYCGGKYDYSELEQVGESGVLMCGDCSRVAALMDVVSSRPMRLTEVAQRANVSPSKARKTLETEDIFEVHDDAWPIRYSKV